MGSASQIAVAVLLSFSSAEAETCPAVIRIARAIESSLALGGEQVKARRPDAARPHGNAMR